MIHQLLTDFGQNLGGKKIGRKLLTASWRINDPTLRQTIAGLDFDNPIGLAAGFDYQAQLTQILPSLGFGFGTVGTITLKPYEGNSKPRLARLVHSRSLMVNKGYKNAGIDQVLNKLLPLTFSQPVGISLGQTNTTEITTHQAAIDDIVASCKKIASSPVPFSYYELNISCPNLLGRINFYEPERLRELLDAVASLNLTRPLFVKMPINESDEKTLALIEVITQFPVAGIIIGNLQKDRTDPAFAPFELARYPQGNFSGKPTWNRSNQLIKLAYRQYGQKLIIVGCGGVFSAQDAYEKIQLGASLIQLITGLIYQGPQLPGQINAGLVALLRRDKYKNISQAIGVASK